MSKHSKFMNIIYAINLYSGIYSIIGIISFEIVIRKLEGYGRVNYFYNMLTIFCAILMIVNFVMKKSQVRSRAPFVILLIFMIPLVLFTSLGLLASSKILLKLFYSWNI